MFQEQMSLIQVYACRQIIEAAGKTLYYRNQTGQCYTLHLAPPEEIQFGKQYPVFIERQDGQLLRKYLPGSVLIFLG